MNVSFIHVSLCNSNSLLFMVHLHAYCLLGTQVLAPLCCVLLHEKSELEKILLTFKTSFWCIRRPIKMCDCNHIII